LLRFDRGGAGEAGASEPKGAIMGKLVRDAMTPDPRTIGAGASVVEAARIMEEADVGALPVVDSDRILHGMVTDRDIALRVVAAGRDPVSTTVGEIATTTVSPAYPDEPLDEAYEQMAYRQVRRLPVIDDDRVIGMLAQADMVHELKDKQAGKLVDEISQEPARLGL
jgi:CBS domain-containing protein